MFLDDGLGGNSSYKECLDISMGLKYTFESYMKSVTGCHVKL